MKTQARDRLQLAGLLALMMVAACSPTPYEFHGTLLDPASAAPDFTLTDQNGEPFHLGDQRGAVVLLFFGYTSCPDVCPATLALFKQTREALGDLASGARFVFVTIDPAHDSPERMREYLEQIDPTIFGLTGTEGELEPVWAAYGVYRLAQPAEGESESGFDHNARVYVIDRQGNLRLSYAFGFAVEDVTQDVGQLIGEE